MCFHENRKWCESTGWVCERLPSINARAKNIQLECRSWQRGQGALLGFVATLGAYFFHMRTAMSDLFIQCHLTAIVVSKRFTCGAGRPRRCKKTNSIPQGQAQWWQRQGKKFPLKKNARTKTRPCMGQSSVPTSGRASKSRCGLLESTHTIWEVGRGN